MSQQQHPLAGLSGSLYGRTHFASAATTSPESAGNHHSPQDGTSKGSGSGIGVGTKRSRPTGGTGSDDEDGGDDKKRRNRQALSCGERPCVACIRRGTPEGCSWEDSKIEPQAQPFALVTDVKRLAARLMSVEKFLQTLPPELRAGAPKPDLTSNTGTFPLDTSHEIQDVKPEDDLFCGLSDTEEATVELEAAAFKTSGPDARGPMRAYNPAAASPFAILSPPTNPELTSALTSIVALPLNLEGEISSTQLGLEWGLTQEQIPGAYRAALEKIYGCFPDQRTSYILLDRYIEDFAWLHNIFHEPSIRAEHDRYWEMVNAGRRGEVCPIWLAVYCMIMALAVDGVKASSSIPGVTSQREQAVQWYNAAQRLLQLGNWLATPQVRCILVMLLFVQWGQVSAGRQPMVFLSWLSSGIRIAQQLGLHMLGTDPETMPVADPAWPPHPCSLRREQAIRIFGCCVFMDSLSATTNFPAYVLHPSQYTTPFIGNFNDADLSTTEVKCTPLPRNVLTDSSFEYLKRLLAEQGRTVFDKLISDGSQFSYSTVLELDRGYRQILDQLPDAWRHEHTTLEAKFPKLRVRRHIVHDGVHSRIMRLHRPFLTRGYSPNSRYSYSTEQCVASAKIVIAAHHNILNETNNMYFVYLHSLAAAIVLFADLCHAIDNDYSDSEIEEKKNNIIMAFEIFGSHSTIPSPHLKEVVKGGSRILSGLFMVVEKRRVTRAAHKFAPGGPDAQPSPESFAQVLVRISRDLNLQQSLDSPSSGTPAPSTNLTSSVAPPKEVLSTQVAAPAVDFDPLSAQFLQDLGIPTGDDSLSYWAQPTQAGGAATGFTPPDFSFLNNSDWAFAQGQNPLLEQLSIPW
ncbi:Zn(2)-C6 fungal-type transcription factor [Pseudohyphozyma bogoriensis]|nr:Zn(2)-C6 fungal-type transcription factor [Pseudohyphozyma bogoriensis]